MISIDKTSKKPFYEQIILSIKEDILQGIIAPGDKLPSVREMASLVLMNPNTVSKAYKSLEEQGVIITIIGKGTFANQLDTDSRNEVKIAKIKQKVTDLVIEATYLNVTKSELLDWINDATKELGGAHDAN